jgi:hypothetical protein
MRDNTLTPFQKELFDFTIQKHYDMTGGIDATLEEELGLVLFIKEFELLETSTLILDTGKLATKEQKFIFWFRQNFNEIEKIFNLV